MTVHVSEDDIAYQNNIRKFLDDYFQRTDEGKIVTIGVSGGSMPKCLCPVLKSLPKQKQIRIFPVDERLVLNNHPENNMSMYVKELSDEYDDSQFIRVHEKLINNGLMAAAVYEKTLKELNPELSFDGFPVFDILFLGIGPDGHTCSLFPGHSLLQEKSLWVASIEDSPKPPPRRVTITLPVINKAVEVVFLVTGESKAQVVKEIIEDCNKSYTPSLIERKETKWFLDKAAASSLSSSS